MRPEARREADALLLSLRMAERHQHWGMFSSISAFIRDAGWRMAYLGPGEYALEAPSPSSSNPPWIPNL